MKHKKFNEVKPYVYFIKDKKTGLKYFGARYQNFTRKRLTPNQDLGKEYFSSHKILSKKFSNKRDDYFFKPIFTFDTVEETLEFELKHNKKIIRDKRWINSAAFPAIIHDEKSKQKASKRMTGSGNPNYGKTLSQAYKNKIANSLKGNKSPWYGKKHHPETIKKMINSKTGKKKTKEQVEKMKTTFGGTNNPMYGRKHSKEAIKRMSISAKKRKKRYGQKFSAETRKKISDKAKERYKDKNYREKMKKVTMLGKLRKIS